MKWVAEYFVVLLAIIPTVALSEETFVLTESSIMAFLEKSPEISRIKSNVLAQEFNYKKSKDPFSWSLEGTASTESSRERSVVAQVPVTSKASLLSLEFNRPFSNGIDIGIGYSQQKVSSFVDNAATNRFVGKVDIDLFKNFLGRNSKAVLQDAKFGYEAAKLQGKIDEKALRFRVRSLFWNYIAAKESKDLADELLASSTKQLKLVRRKLRSDVADSGDIARFSSQVSERQSQSLQFEASMRQFEVNFGEFFPELAGKKISLGNYDKSKTMASFYQCLGVIEAQKEVPKQYTLFDEIIDLRRKQLEEQKKSILTTSDIDLKLSGEIGLVGTGIGTSAASSSLTDDGNDFNSVALTLSMPLDGKKRETEKVQIQLAEAQIDAEVRALDARFSSLHNRVVENIKLIKKVIESRSENNDFLKKALLDSRKKYRQARLTSQQLLQEEDKYLSNAIQLITTQRDLLLFMFDYLSLFTETPCQLNEVQ